MSKSLLNKIFCIVILFVLLIFRPTNALAVQNICPYTRLQTDIAIAGTYTNDPRDNIILASKNDFADALSVSVLANKMLAPILLADKTASNSTDALDYIRSHMAPRTGTVWIAGGTGAIDSSFDQAISAMGYIVKRISGSDRYETAVLVAKQENLAKGTPVFIVSGENFPDALSIESVATSYGYPILLVSKDNLPEQVISSLTDIQPSKIYMIGDLGAIPAASESAIKALVPSAAVLRIAGQSRYDTAAKVYQEFYPNASKLYIATGNNFTDALAGTVMAAKAEAPIVLVDPTSIVPPEPISNYLKTLTKPYVTILGGPSVISDSLAANIYSILNPITDNSDRSNGNFKYVLNSLSATNNFMSLSGVVSPGTTSVRVSVIKTGERPMDTSYVPVPNRLFLKPVDLNAGAGTYTVNVYETSSTSDETLRKSFTVVNTDVGTAGGTLPSREVESGDPRIVALAKSITSKTSSDYAKSKAIHDWVATHIAYDVAAFRNKNYGNQSALSVLTSEKGVCEGYSNLNAALNRAIGIPAKVIHGTSIDYSPSWLYLDTTLSHAWNEVYLDGRWVTEDVTWDAGYASLDLKTFTFKLSAKYFDQNPDTFAMDHKKISETDY